MPVSAPAKSILGVTVATTSGTQIDFTGISPKAKRITLILKDVSFSVFSSILALQLGTSGGVETTGYVNQGLHIPTGNLISGNQFTVNMGNSFGTPTANIGVTGEISLVKGSGNLWIASYNVYMTDQGANAGSAVGAGYKTLIGTLDRVRFSGGTFDSGEITMYVEA